MMIKFGYHEDYWPAEGAEVFDVEADLYPVTAEQLQVWASILESAWNAPEGELRWKVSKITEAIRNKLANGRTAHSRQLVPKVALESLKVDRVAYLRHMKAAQFRELLMKAFEEDLEEYFKVGEEEP